MVPADMSWKELKRIASEATGLETWKLFLVWYTDGRVGVTIHSRRVVGMFEADGSFAPR